MKRTSSYHGDRTFLTKFFMLCFFLGITMFTYAQQKITGNVSDATGEPIIGASVIVKGTTNGTITDFDGNFTLNAPAKSVLEVSYVGYQTQTVTVGDGPLKIILQEDTEQLDEVVVVGYGSVRKRDLTGSISTVGADKLKERSFGNALQSMAGQVSGIQITQTQGAPGAAGAQPAGDGAAGGGIPADHQPD